MRPLDLLWLVPALPIAGAALNGLICLFWPKAPKATATLIGVGFPGVSMLVALAAIWQYLHGTNPAPFEQTLWSWTAGTFSIPIAFLLDPLSVVMLFIVTFVGFWIHVYSAGYMSHEPGYRRYFAYLNLFMGAMLLLILANNFLVMFVGWEGVGLCSYLLIGFYFDQSFPPQAGRKAFIVNRIGDFAFLVGMFALAAKYGTLTYSKIFPVVVGAPEALKEHYALGLTFAGFVALCFFIGAMGKSAQIPLYVWLPDAMAGPTPVSALIHAATMVTAGVYMVVRSNAIYQLAPEIGTFVAVIGAFTAILAASIGLVQNDIKKVLAYSTVSQLGYMFLAAGLGAYTAAVFHLGTHAFFKALLFLGSGSVIHSMGGEQDMRKMGGLRKYMPITFWTFALGTAAIAGVPGLAGFFSKDEILHNTAATGHWGLFAIGLFTAGLTAFYMVRAVAMTFFGKFRGTHDQEHHLHESPWVMTVPLLVLAAGAVGSGWVGIPELLGGGNTFHHFLSPVIADFSNRLPEHAAEQAEMAASTEWLLLIASVLAGLIGIGYAFKLYGRGEFGGAVWAKRFPAVYRLLDHKYWVDEIYDRLIIRPLGAFSRFLWKGFDDTIVDGSVRALAWATELTAEGGRLSTTGNVRSYALYFFLGVLGLFWWILR
ncbi:MAG TPA: NADH-quinone oxidoreductase subunit L [Thermoanaerobaculia bacterium]|jgi:NADH-quinone oxidoreductase subunit L|nr:NADH-quinone oxidoreductase subunit L [Thermoanaerobaculia bacterium]